MQALTKADAALLSLLAGAAFGAPVRLEENTDFAAVLEAARRQALVGVAGEGLEALQEGAVLREVLHEWQSYTLALIRKNERLLQAQTRLLALCRKAQIPAVIMKGFCAALDYPTPDLRAGGDVDCLVPRERLDALCALLEENGYQREAGLDEHHVGYECDGVLLEIHFQISGMPQGESGAILTRAFADIFERAEQATLAGACFPIPCARHRALILILHIAKHLCDGGVGLRQVLDFALFLHRHADAFDATLVELLREAGLYRFTCALTQGCVRYLQLPAEDAAFCKDACDEALCEALFADFLKGANFGAGARLEYAGSGMAHKGRRRFEPVLFSAVRGVCDMCRLEWPAAKKCSLLLLFLVPFWVIRRLLDRTKPRVRPLRMLHAAGKRATVHDALALFVCEASPENAHAIDTNGK